MLTLYIFSYTFTCMAFFNISRQQIKTHFVLYLIEAYTIITHKINLIYNYISNVFNDYMYYTNLN